MYDALGRLKAAGAIVADGKGPRGTVSYRMVMEPVQPPHRAATAPVQSATPGGAVTSTEGVQPTAPEPSLEPSVEPSSLSSVESKRRGREEEVVFSLKDLPRPKRMPTVVAP